MFIAHFTERPYQDPASGYFGATGKSIKDLTLSNEIYDPELGANLYNRYLDERLYAEEMGFDGLMLNEHHSTPFCMGGAMNIEAAILARMTKRAKIVLLGNIIPIWDDPLWAGRAACHHRYDFTWQARLRVGTRHWARERIPQRAAAIQLGTLPGSTRLHR